MLAAWGVQADVHAVELAASELVSNAICHGTGAVQVELLRVADRVRLVVHDEGSAGGAGPVVRDKQIGGLTPGGWGLRLVDQVADRWGITAEDGHTRVWMETQASELAKEG